LDNKAILVLDDEESLLIYLVNEMRSAGYRAYGMESKELALDWMKEHRPDLVISDVSSPGMNGVEFIRALKTHPDLAQTAVIVVSGNINLERAIELKKLGASDVLLKPFQMKELLSAIQETLQN
jgi:DNA-binding response OmpR family regulator